MARGLDASCEFLSAFTRKSKYRTYYQWIPRYGGTTNTPMSYRSCNPE